MVISGKEGFDQLRRIHSPSIYVRKAKFCWYRTSIMRSWYHLLF